MPLSIFGTQYLSTHEAGQAQHAKSPVARHLEMRAKHRLDDQPAPVDAAIAILVEPTEPPRRAALAVEVGVRQRPAAPRLVLAAQLDLRIGAVVQVDHPFMAGQFAVQRDESVAL